MQLSPVWEANSSSAGQAISHILWILKINYHLHEILKTVLRIDTERKARTNTAAAAAAAAAAAQITYAHEECWQLLISQQHDINNSECQSI